jgi:hypothetical protein
MQPHDHKTEIAALELQLKEFEKLLDEYITDNEILSKSKVILQEIKRISQRIIALKSLDETTNN